MFQLYKHIPRLAIGAKGQQSSLRNVVVNCNNILAKNYAEGNLKSLNIRALAHFPSRISAYCF